MAVILDSDVLSILQRRSEPACGRLEQRLSQLPDDDVLTTIVYDIHLLPMTSEHIEPLTTLALHHRDPSDRLPVSTAIAKALTFVSADEPFDDYGLPRLW